MYIECLMYGSCFPYLISLHSERNLLLRHFLYLFIDAWLQTIISIEAEMMAHLFTAIFQGTNKSLVCDGYL